MAVRSREARKSRTIQRVRTLLLLALIATVVAVVALLMFGGDDEGAEREAMNRVEPGSLDAERDLISVGEGFERTVSEGDRSLFTVRGDTYSVDQEEVVSLEGVEIIIYGEGETAYSLVAPRASFEQDRERATLSGGVVLTGTDGLRLETEELRLVQRGRQVLSSGKVYIRLGDRMHGRADRLRVLLKASRYILFGHARIASLEGAEHPFVLTARRVSLDRTRHLVEVEEGPVRLEHMEDWLVSDRLIVYFDEAEERIQYLRARNWLVAEIRSAQALVADESGRRMERGGEEELTSEPSVSEQGLRDLGAPDLSRLRLHAESLDLEMTPDGLHPHRLQLEGGPRGLASVRSFAAASGGASETPPIYRLEAPRIDGLFEEGRPRAFEAAERVRVALLEDVESAEREIEAELTAWWEVIDGQRDPEDFPAPPDDPARRARGRRAEAAFDADGALGTLTLVDEVVVLDGATRAEGSRGVFRVPDDLAEVVGDPAVVVTPRIEMTAPTIGYDRAEGILRGGGGVRARLDRRGSSEGTSALDGTPLGEGEGPVWVEADQGFFREDPQSFLFVGSVRAWRGDNLLTGSRLRGDDAEGGLTASGDVRTLWIPTDPTTVEPAEEPGRGVPEDSTGASTEAPIEVTADEMAYRRQDNVLVYTGDVVAEQERRILACREMEMHLRAGDDGADGGRLDRLICTGDVRMSESDGPGRAQQGSGRTLSGHRAVYDPNARTIDVVATDDGQVVMKDPEGNVIEGPRMIYEIERERVRVLPREESAPADGGATGGADEAADRAAVSSENGGGSR